MISVTLLTKTKFFDRKPPGRPEVHSPGRTPGQGARLYCL